jgi:hypothetical protein
MFGEQGDRTPPLVGACVLGKLKHPKPRDMETRGGGCFLLTSQPRLTLSSHGMAS